jgi:ComF family protein
MVAVNDFEPDAVTWVPLSGRRRAQRGYDQSRALARSIGRRLDLPVVRLVDRIRDTPAQATLSRRLRVRAVRGAFRARGAAMPAKVLLVDDVLTTGATAAACARALRSAGASRVGLLTVARSLSGPLPARCYTRAGSRLGLWLPGERPR